MSSQYGSPHDMPPQQMYPPPVPGQQQHHPQQHQPHHHHEQHQHQHQHQQPRHYSSMPPPPHSYQQHYPPPQQMPPMSPHDGHQNQQQLQALPGQHGFHPRLEPAPHPRHQLPHQSIQNPQMVHQQGHMQHQGHHGAVNAGPINDGRTLGQLTTYCMVDEAAGRKYQLQIFQQPIRARMCGFGDKDRRPITPPPCVRLTILSLASGREIDISEIDPLTFVLNVDLWDAEGQKEVNLVRATNHHNSSSSNAATSAANAASYSYNPLGGADGAHGHYNSKQTPHHPQAPNRDAGYNLSPQVSYPSDFSLQSSYAPPATQYSNPGYAPAQGYYPSQQYRQDAAPAPTPSSYNRTGSVASSTGYNGDPSRSGSTASSHQGMSSRNLIGSLAVSAFRLTDNDGKLGIWFVLQDLSVRTEGQFRLRFSAVNVAKPTGAPRDGSNPQVNRGHVPMLASGFSDVFTVYSAKKFPGVCESTPLSKTFATQGVKIPIRKDGAAKGDDDDDE